MVKWRVQKLNFHKFHNHSLLIFITHSILRTFMFSVPLPGPLYSWISPGWLLCCSGLHQRSPPQGDLLGCANWKHPLLKLFLSHVLFSSKPCHCLNLSCPIFCYYNQFQYYHYGCHTNKSKHMLGFSYMPYTKHCGVFLFFLLFICAYKLGSFLLPAPTPSLTTHSTPFLSPPHPLNTQQKLFCPYL
jgi:hypothetical protein